MVRPHRICVIGRRGFSTGIGTVTHSALELLSISFDVEFFDARVDGQEKFLTLDSGRRIPVAPRLSGFDGYFYTDVLWNYSGDVAARSVPPDGYRVAHVAWDSDVLPLEWVEIANSHFDLFLGMTEAVASVARSSGVTIDVGVLPLAVPLEAALATPYAEPGGILTFGTLSAFHPRKELLLLVDSFASTFGDDPAVKLRLHSNLKIGNEFERITSRVKRLATDNIEVSSSDMTNSERDSFLQSIDIYACISRGEGYSIGPREALALGKAIVVSDVKAHDDLRGVAGVSFIESSGWRPAVYPEIENRIFGRQGIYQLPAVSAALRDASEYVRSGRGKADAIEKKRRASLFTNSTLIKAYARVFDRVTWPDLNPRANPYVMLPDSQAPFSSTSRGRPRAPRRVIVVPVRDAGFFSLFNAYASHLAWTAQEPCPPMVLPDWNISRLLEASPKKPLVSYCYSTPEDGNLWNSLFLPPYGLGEEDMNEILDKYAIDFRAIDDVFNGRREPLLTYVHAHDLYRASWFPRFRRQYGAAVRDHVQLRPELAAELDETSNHVGSRFLVAAHVKHPSHAVEQPLGILADRFQHVRAVQETLRSEGIDPDSDDWRVFLATDQERVVALFAEEFGTSLLSYPGVARVEAATDDAFDALTDDVKGGDGHQLQHQLAADAARWSTRNAWEVWRDAEMMAKANVLFHSVSNVVTAVSYLGPKVEMRYLEPH